MHIVDRFPHDVRDLEHVTITLRDGVRLAARIWLPATAARRPAPAVLEAIPYRKRDGTRLRDEPMHRWFAGHGIAAVRLDLRGTGESEGVLLDEYTETEQLDAVEVIEWIARQPWCDGHVAMIGKSWGGFAALQVAALRPAALGAVVAVCASDDRYADDAHYMGGCLLNENLLWGSMLMALCAQPPSPQHHGERWHELWRTRLESVRPFPAVWLRNPRRDTYWRQGSVCEDYGAIAVPVLAISGWADGYTNAVLRLLAGLSGERYGWIGPWGHSYPHEGRPGPAAGFLQEARAFLERGLRGSASEFAGRPRLRAWLQQPMRPDPDAAERPGRWVAEAEWPSPRIAAATRTWRFGADRLHAAGEVLPAAGHGTRRASSPQTVGRDAGSWCAFGLEGEQPGDQRQDDAASLCFDSAPLAEPLTILGAPVVRLRVAVDRPRAFVCVRLCEVFADGASARVSYGLLDLTHRLGHDRSVAMPVAAPVDVEVALNDTGHVFAAGSRLRVAVSTTYWPMVWPMPLPVTLLLHLPHCELALPARPPDAGDHRLPPVPPAEAAPPPPHRDLDPGGVHRRVFDDPETGELVHETVMDLETDGRPSRVEFADIGQEFGHGIRETFRIRRDEPLSARAEVLHRTVTRSNAHEVFVELRSSLYSDLDGFHFRAVLEARRAGDVVTRREWHEFVPRPALEPPA